MIVFDQPIWYYLLAALVCVVAVARVTRLISQDTWPPAVAFRNWWRKVTKDGDWSELVTCPFCVSPYLTAISLAWAALSDLHWTWWAAHLLAAIAYLSAAFVAQDT